MQALALGDSGAEVSALCLGTLPFGTKVNESDSFALLDGYFDAGGRFLDTANNYSRWHAEGVGGESESVIGRWMKERGNRSQLFVATKVGFNAEAVGLGLSAGIIASELDASLKRLGTEYTDLYYAHGDIRTDPLDESLEAFDRAVTSGKVRHIGCSNYRAWRIERARNLSRANGWSAYCCVQQRFSFLRPRPGADFGRQLSANEDLLDYCTENPQVRMLAYSPLLSGAYSRDDRPLPEQYVSVESGPRLAVLKGVCSECGATPHQVVYAWMLQANPGVIPLSAPTTMAQLEENLGALEVVLSGEQIQRLSASVVE